MPTGDNLIVSPADGVVTGTEEVDMPDFPGGRALRVSIFLSVFSVHINRAPFAMKTAVVRYYPGLFLDARHADCAERNEQLWVDGFAAKNGLPIRLKQISGAIARRIVCRTKPGDGLNAGENRVLLSLPADLADRVDDQLADLLGDPGQLVVAGQLAEILADAHPVVGDPRQVAARILDRDELVGKRLDHADHRFGLDVGHGAAGDIVEDDRQVALVRKMGEMGVHTLLIGAVVIRGNHQSGGPVQSLRFARLRAHTN